MAVADRVSLVLLGSAKGGIIVYNHGLKTRVEIQRVLVVSQDISPPLTYLISVRFHICLADDRRGFRGTLYERVEDATIL